MKREAATRDLSVAVCTRDRPAQLQRTLRALRSDSGPHVEITVVDQSAGSHPIPAEVEARDPSAAVVCDSGRGAARARNLGWRRANAEWILFVDDDCVPHPGLLQELRAAIARCPEASLVTGGVDWTPVREVAVFPVAAFPLREEQLRSGRWTDPIALGYSVFTAIRRAALEQLWGFYGQLGPEPGTSVAARTPTGASLQPGRCATCRRRTQARHRSAAGRGVLSEPRFAARAEEIAFWSRNNDGAVAAATLVERYVGR